MSIEWSIAVLSILTIGNYWIKRSVLYPPFLFCSIWLLGLVLDRLNLVETDELHAGTLAFIAAGAAVFTAGGLIALLVPKTLIETRLILTRFPQRNHLVKPLIMFFLLCGVPMQIHNLRMLAAQGEGGTFLERARNAGITGHTIEGLSAEIAIYFVFWTLFASILFMLERRDKYFWAMAFMAFVMSILTTGRTSLLQLFVALICVQLITSHRTRFWAALRLVRVPIASFLFLYIGLVFVNKTSQTQFYGTTVGQVVLVFFVSYIVGPLAAFDHYLRDPGNTASIPNHTFKFYLNIAAHLHLIQYEPPPVLDSFTGVPYPVNVYTMYKDYINDFGAYGALVAAAIIGFFHVLLYRKALAGSFLGTFLFSLSMFPAAMSIFTDQYSSLGNWTDAALFGGIYVILQSLPIRLLPKVRDGYAFPA